MLNKTIWFGLILSIASAALAQEEVGPDSATETVEAVSAQATQTCQVTYSSGIDNTAMRFCVTVNGNISQFSVRRNRLFAEEGDPGDLEGYGVCDSTGGQRYYGYAAYDNGLWNASKLQHKGDTVTVTRTTRDGNWELTQSIVNVPATASAVGSAKVTMKLKNLSKVGRAATLLRYAAVNGYYTNSYNATSMSASGQFASAAGLMITLSSFPHGFNYGTYIQNIQSGPDPCKPFTNADPDLPIEGLDSIVAFWQNNTIKTAPGAELTVSSTYTPF